LDQNVFVSLLSEVTFIGKASTQTFHILFCGSKRAKRLPIFTVFNGNLRDASDADGNAQVGVHPVRLDGQRHRGQLQLLDLVDARVDSMKQFRPEFT
jgi:hypothetical protein